MRRIKLKISTHWLTDATGSDGPIKKIDNYYIFICPHCGGGAQVFEKDVRCTIFRHGVYKSNGKPIPPHTPKRECVRLINGGEIYGCGKPFRFDRKTVSICGYI